MRTFPRSRGEAFAGRSTNLGVDHLVYRPPTEFYRKLFAYLLRHQEARGAVYTVSYVYAPLFEGEALKVATEKRIPLVFAGYSPGQPDPERMLYEFRPGSSRTPTGRRPALRESERVLGDDELARFWNPRRYPAGHVVSPLPRAVSCVGLRSGRDHEAHRCTRSRRARLACKPGRAATIR